MSKQRNIKYKMAKKKICTIGIIFLPVFVSVIL
jgi:hypothetical protein